MGQAAPAAPDRAASCVTCTSLRERPSLAAPGTGLFHVSKMRCAYLKGGANNAWDRVASSVAHNLLRSRSREMPFSSRGWIARPTESWDDFLTPGLDSVFEMTIARNPLAHCCIQVLQQYLHANRSRVSAPFMHKEGASSIKAHENSCDSTFINED